MGFNKRYINKESLMEYKKQGLQSLINFIKKPDSLIIEDEFSQKVCNIVLEADEKHLFSELSKIGFY